MLGAGQSGHEEAQLSFLGLGFPQTQGQGSSRGQPSGLHQAPQRPRRSGHVQRAGYRLQSPQGCLSQGSLAPH